MIELPVGPPATPRDDLPDLGTTVRWRSWLQGRREAQERGMPLVGFVAEPWSNAAQRLARALGRDDRTRTHLEEALVPVWLDPARHPDVAHRWRTTSRMLCGHAGPPVLVIATPAGDPFLAYPSMRPEGTKAFPSLAALLRSVHEGWAERGDALRHEAQRLRGCRPERPTRDGVEEPVPEGAPLHPPLRWARDVLSDGDAAERAQLERILAAVARGGIRDPLDGAFHRCARDEHWVKPHFEKLAPHNAALAEVYASAAERLDRPDFRKVAEGAAAFALRCLEQGVDGVASDPHHYTWTPSALQEALSPNDLQAVALHVHMTRSETPHVLYGALEPESLGQYAQEPVEVLRERLHHGMEELRRARAERPAPGVVRSGIPAWRAETLRAACRARTAGLDVPVSTLERHLEGLLAAPWRDGAGYLRGEAAWLEDQAALAAACLAALEAGVEDAAEPLARLTGLLAEAYVAEDGAYDRPRGEREEGAVPSAGWVDDVVPAPVPTAVDAMLGGAEHAPDGAEDRVRAAGRALQGARPPLGYAPPPAEGAVGARSASRDVF